MRSFSPFYGTSLEPILRARNLQRIYLGCVQRRRRPAAVRDAHDRDYVCTIIEDCCASATTEQHLAAMLVLGRFADVTTSADVTFQG